MAKKYVTIFDVIGCYNVEAYKNMLATIGYPVVDQQEIAEAFASNNIDSIKFLFNYTNVHLYKQEKTEIKVRNGKLVNLSITDPSVINEIEWQEPISDSDEEVTVYYGTSLSRVNVDNITDICMKDGMSARGQMVHTNLEVAKVRCPWYAENACYCIDSPVVVTARIAKKYLYRNPMKSAGCGDEYAFPATRRNMLKIISVVPAKEFANS